MSFWGIMLKVYIVQHKKAGRIAGVFNNKQAAKNYMKLFPETCCFGEYARDDYSWSEHDVYRDWIRGE